jgi:hypothetical protein
MNGPPIMFMPCTVPAAQHANPQLLRAPPPPACPHMRNPHPP